MTRILYPVFTLAFPIAKFSEFYFIAAEAATPATITIDYILDERMREYYGEGQRWFELARTQTIDK